MTAGALMAAISTAGLALTSSTVTLLAFRFLTGIGLACVYPPGMKLAASWFRDRRGIALGTVVGALVVGKAVPYLVAALTDHWRAQSLLLAGMATAGAVLIALAGGEGPYVAATARLNPRAIREVLSQRETRLSTYGYLGHMWELYAMWTWFGAFAAAAVAASGTRDAALQGRLRRDSGRIAGAACVPALAADYGWQWVFIALLPGPLAGLAAMRRFAIPR